MSCQHRRTRNERDLRAAVPAAAAADPSLCLQQGEKITYPLAKNREGERAKKTQWEYKTNLFQSSNLIFHFPLR